MTLTLPMPPERIVAHPRARQPAGQVALQRGPVVYCFEEADNGPDLAAVLLPDRAAVTAEHRPRLLGGCTVLSAEGLREPAAAWGRDLYRSVDAVPAPEPCRLTAIPYALWANRKPGEMRVWVRRAPGNGKM
ncbi:MAG: hypothetical protein ACOCX4_00900 [Planctomycetota bacterium]